MPKWDLLEGRPTFIRQYSFCLFEFVTYDSKISHIFKSYVANLKELREYTVLLYVVIICLVRLPLIANLVFFEKN